MNVKMWYICAREYNSALKEGRILSFARTKVRTESIVLSEISQTEENKYFMVSLMRVEEHREGLVKDYELSVISRMKSEKLTYNTVL